MEIASAEEIEERLKRSEEFAPMAIAITKTLSNKNNAINKIANATRGNTASEYDASDIHRLQAAIGKESAKRFKESITRYINK